jgi:hypothetical protein
MPIDPFSSPPPTLACQYKVREPSILFTLNDLKIIKHYVGSYGRLPVTSASIAKSFNTSEHTLGPLVLKAIVELNQAVIAHVNTWPKLEEEAALLGSELEAFSKSFIETLNHLIDTIKSTPAWSRFNTFAEIENVEPPSEISELHAADEKALDTLGGVLDYMENQVEAYLNRVSEVHELARIFRDTITYELEDHISRAVSALTAFGIDEKISEVERNIEALKEQVASQQRNLEYFESVIEYSWAGSLLGRAIGALVVGNGREDAEQVISVLTEKIASHNRSLRDLHPFKAKLVEYAVTLSSLEARLDAVVNASNRLLGVWREFKANIGESKKQLGFITRQEQLSLLELKFRNANAPWRDIHKQSQELNELFDAFSKDEQPLLQQGAEQ